MARKPLTMATVKPIRIAGGRSVRSGSLAYGGVMQLQLDAKAVARAQARLEKFRDKPLHVRMDRATKAAGELLLKPMQAAAPRRTGKLRKSVSSRTVANRDRPVFAKSTMRAIGADRVALVGPRAAHRHLIIRGHRIVTPGGRDTGRRTQPNPFVDDVSRRHGSTAVRLMREHIVTAGLSEGVGNAIVFGKPVTRRA